MGDGWFGTKDLLAGGVVRAEGEKLIFNCRECGKKRLVVIQALLMTCLMCAGCVVGGCRDTQMKRHVPLDKKLVFSDIFAKFTQGAWIGILSGRTV
ncbi:hypothetical protein BD408DRAFT_419036, partial [Parasitella parasitica]